MKKSICALALALGMSLFCHAQNSVTMTLNIDHADRITVKYYDASYNTVYVDNLKDGDNTLTVPVGSYDKSVDVIAKDGYGLEACTYLNAGATEAVSRDILYMKSSYFNASTDPTTEGAVWSVKTFDFAERRTAHATFKVDDSSKVRVTRVNSNTEVTLDNGDNNVAFIPAEGDTPNESIFSITATDPYKPIYKVTINGVEVEDYDKDNSYVTIADNDIVIIEANFPDIEVPVRFTYSDNGFGFVTKVAADGMEVPFDGYTAMVKCGSNVEFWYDERNYILNSIAINGKTEEYPWSPLSLGIISSETSVAIDADKVGNYTFDVKVNDASYIKLLAFEEGASIYYGGQEIPLVSGENKDIEVSDKLHFFSIEANTRSKLKALSLNGVKIEQVEKTDYSGGTYLEWPFPIEIKQGDVLEITGAGPVRDNDAVVYIDKIPEGSYSFDLNLNGYKPTLTDGYNFVKYDDDTDAEIGDLPFRISLYYSPMSSWLYLNGEEVNPKTSSTYANDYELTEVTSGSVLKLFTAEEPKMNAVSFTATGIADSNLKVSKDYITEVSNPTIGFTAVGPTIVKIEVTDTPKVEVKANGEAINPAEDGTYTLTVDSDTAIEVTGASGITDAAKTGNADNATFEVYTIQGIAVNRAATKADLTKLPAGLYIINGKKVRL